MWKPATLAAIEPPGLKSFENKDMNFSYPRSIKVFWNLLKAKAILPYLEQVNTVDNQITALFRWLSFSCCSILGGVQKVFEKSSNPKFTLSSSRATIFTAKTHYDTRNHCAKYKKNELGLKYLDREKPVSLFGFIKTSKKILLWVINGFIFDQSEIVF